MRDEQKIKEAKEILESNGFKVTKDSYLLSFYKEEVKEFLTEVEENNPSENLSNNEELINQLADKCINTDDIIDYSIISSIVRNEVNDLI